MQYSSLSDDYYVNMNLATEMELLSCSRETVLHYFEQVKKRFPELRNFYTREKGDYVLEGEKETGHYRWTTIEPRRICAGYVNPPSVDEAAQQHCHVLDIAQPLLSLSPLDVEALDFLMGFDFTYRGNHNALIFEALGVSPALERLAEMPGATVIANEPTITLALDEDCRTQCRVSIEPRTNPYQIRTGDYSEEQLSVFVTARQYGSIQGRRSLRDALEHLIETCQHVVDNYVVEQVLQPLARLISLK